MSLTSCQGPLIGPDSLMISTLVAYFTAIFYSSTLVHDIPYIIYGIIRKFYLFMLLIWAFNSSERVKMFQVYFDKRQCSIFEAQN